MTTPLPYDSRAIGQEVLSRLAEIDDLLSEERRAQLRAIGAQGIEQERVDERRLAVLRASVPALTRVADVAARTEHNELMAGRGGDLDADTVDFPDQRIHDPEVAHGEALLDAVYLDWPGEPGLNVEQGGDAR